MGIRHIAAKSVGEGLHAGLHHLLVFGIREPSRNGDVLVSPVPVVTTFERPLNRVLVNRTRDANPFFHLFESMWMLAGRNDLAFPKKFVSTFGQFSDDGTTLHGAYGYRWRNWFGYDQLEVLVEHLTHDPKTRRAVLQMWDASFREVNEAGDVDLIFGDLEVGQRGGKDVPCNTAAYFDTIGGKLNMTVTCRSNDVVLGAYGANAVHFSFLLEYMALRTGIPMGEYRQFSNNYHLYTDLYPNLSFPADSIITSFAESVLASDIYSSPGPLKSRDFTEPQVRHVVPLFMPDEEQFFHEDLQAFMEFDIDDFQSSFFLGVVGPMYRVWAHWKAKEFAAADQALNTILADDWRLAAQDWLITREKRRKENEA